MGLTTAVGADRLTVEVISIRLTLSGVALPVLPVTTPESLSPREPRSNSACCGGGGSAAKNFSESSISSSKDFDMASCGQTGGKVGALLIDWAG
jgi:hypothetical protein